MNYKSYLAIILLHCILVVNSQKCQPLYWEIDPNYSVITNQLDQYAKKTNLIVPNVSEIYGIFGNQTTYQFNNIKTKITYNDSKKQVKLNGNTIYVNNLILNFVFQFNATKIKNLITRQYDGIGTASLSNVSVSYSKNFIIVDGTAMFNLIKANILTPNAVQLEGLVPNPRQEIQIEHFISLATIKMYSLLSTLLNESITFFLFQYLSTQSFENPFGSAEYDYNFNGYITKLNTQINQLTLGNPNGRSIGYNGSLIGVESTTCNQYIPDKPYKASYFTLDFINNLWSSATKNPDWQTLTLDSSNTFSDLFQFYMIDLQDIIPSALHDFPKLLSKLKAVCGIFNFSQVNIDTNYNGFSTQIKWDCGLYHIESSTKITNLQIELAYKTKFIQNNDVLKINIGSIDLISTQWRSQDNYPIVNQILANEYVNSLLSSFNGIETVGSGFRQIPKQNPKYIFEDNLISIIEFNNQKVI